VELTERLPGRRRRQGRHFGWGSAAWGWDISRGGLSGVLPRVEIVVAILIVGVAGGMRLDVESRTGCSKILAMVPSASRQCVRALKGGSRQGLSARPRLPILSNHPVRALHPELIHQRRQMHNKPRPELVY